ncbi:MAG: hypothetical protein QF464_03370, partial [Myxococcota bacterium]|nr:hypothetical protein [Myxococcota bacterium]
MSKVISLWFGFRTTVGRKAYALSGLGLMALKYAVDNALLWGLAGAFMDPLTYLNPILEQRFPDVDKDATVLVLLMALWALPFLWIGVSMSLRRAADAGWSPWVGLLFLVPVLNLVMIAGLCAAPSVAVAEPTEDAPPPALPTHSVVPSAVVAVIVSL